MGGELQVRACVAKKGSPVADGPLGWCTAFKEGVHNLIPHRSTSGTTSPSSIMQSFGGQGYEDPQPTTGSMAQRLAKRRLASSRERQLLKPAVSWPPNRTHTKTVSQSLGEAHVAKLGSKRYDTMLGTE